MSWKLLKGFAHVIQSDNAISLQNCMPSPPDQLNGWAELFFYNHPSQPDFIFSCFVHLVTLAFFDKTVKISPALAPDSNFRNLFHNLLHLGKIPHPCTEVNSLGSGRK